MKHEVVGILKTINQTALFLKLQRVINKVSQIEEIDTDVVVK